MGQRSTVPAALLIGGLAACASRALAEEGGGSTKTDVAGFVDVYAAWNSNRPDDHRSFLPGTGTTAKRADELGLNLAGVDVARSEGRLGGRATFVLGSGTDIVHAGEPAGEGTGAEVWRHLYQAFVGYRLPVGSGLTVDGGIFPCHVGFESFLSKDNWNYTRSWVGEYSPYYSAGVRASYAFTPHLSGQLHVLNGWQIIGDNNDGKTFGTQLAWSYERFAFSVNTMFGPELAGDEDHWRAFVDTVLTVKPTLQLSLGLSVDAGRQSFPDREAATWKGAAGYARHAFSPRWSLAARGEIFDDPRNGITGFQQRLTEGTLTVEHRPVPALILKLEARHDRSTAPVFSGRAGEDEQEPSLERGQTLVLAGAVLQF